MPRPVRRVYGSEVNIEHPGQAGGDTGGFAMARQARIKPSDRGTYYHIMNRISGLPGEFPFDDVEKEKLVRLIREWSHYFTVEPIAYQIMGNHYHLVCYSPGEDEKLSAPKAAERHNRFYGGKAPALAASDPDCERIAERMRDVSAFVGQIQQVFSCWFNRTRAARRRGSLWADRFKTVILERETALFNCIAYVELNCCRAGMVDDPAEYRHGSWGWWCATGKHPFAANLEKHVPAYEGEFCRSKTLDTIQHRLRAFIAETLAEERRQREHTPKEIAASKPKADHEPPLATRASRRLRHWSDGLIIGSKSFVREVAAAFMGRSQAETHRMQPLSRPEEATEVFSWRRLRKIPL